MSDYTEKTMASVRKAFEESGLSLENLGLDMGYPKDSARKSAWQFLNRTTDPRLSMLKRFSDAVGVKVGTIVQD